jgi:hypothetical protein
MFSQILKPLLAVFHVINQGPLIKDGRNSSKWTGHYVGWSKTLKIVKISEQIF